MSEVTQAQLWQVRRLDEALKVAIRRDLQTVWSSVAGRSPDTIKAVLVEAVPDIIDKYGSMSASIAAEWFEELIGEAAFIPDLYSPDAYIASTRWAISPLYREQNSPAEAFSHLVVASERHMKNYGRRVLDESVSRTPGVFYARVPSGPTTCEFCLVMASRGPVYTNRTTAKYRARDGGKYHDSCDCQAVPMRGRWIGDPQHPRGYRWEGDQVAGYRFDDLYEQNYKPFHQSGDQVEQVAARMRAARKA